MYCTKTPIFEARTNGYHVYRIPQILVTHSGVVLATAESRRNTGSDWADIDILMRRSLDGGHTWQPQHLVVSSKSYGGGPISNFVLINDTQAGIVRAVYHHNYARLFTMFSFDDAVTFSEPVEITNVLEATRQEYPWRVVATGPGHGTQLRNGRLIIPTWISDGSGKEFGEGLLGHRPSALTVIYSDDHGETWLAGEIICRDGENEIRNPSETVAAELSDGRILFNIRSESDRCRRLQTISADGATGWSTPEFIEELIEPTCMGSMIRHDFSSGDKGRILFANPNTLDKTMFENFHDRKQLTVRISYDDGNTWSVKRLLEEGASGYSDMTVLPNGDILCLYECGQVDHICDDKYLMLARFNIEWIEALQEIQPL